MLEAQGQFDKYKIVVSNNCSNYNVEEYLAENLSKDFFDIITIYNRPFNVGADINIAFTYQLCDTKWMWLLSDDDKVLPEAVSIVLGDIQKADQASHIKYSIQGYASLPNKSCKNFEEVLDVFNAPTVEAGYGQFVFMSNNVINLEKVKPYIGLAPHYSCTCITQLIPSIFAIKKENIPWEISSRSITNYEIGRTPYINIYVKANFSNISLIDVDFTEKEINKIKKMFAGFKGIMNDVNILGKLKSRSKRRIIFYRLWTGTFPVFSKRGILFYLSYQVKNFWK
jgi:hypothetical protein